MVDVSAYKPIILTVSRNHEKATHKLQISINKFIDWTDFWRIKLNAVHTHQ